eukprot:scaffold38135_cov31-Tisochrysis_lutea.AAC.3
MLFSYLPRAFILPTLEERSSLRVSNAARSAAMSFPSRNSSNTISHGSRDSTLGAYCSCAAACSIHASSPSCGWSSRMAGVCAGSRRQRFL